MDNLIVQLGKFFSSGIAQNKVTILNFHRVVECRDPLRGDGLQIDTFYKKMKQLKKYFSVISLTQAIELSALGDLPPYAVVITIDDGYKDGHSNITPILNELQLSGSFFITTEGIESGMLWKDKIIENIRHTDYIKLYDFLDCKEIAIGSMAEKYLAIQTIANKLKYYSIEKRDRLLEELESKIGGYSSQGLFLTRNDIVEMHNAGMEIGAHTHRHPILKQENLEDAKKEILDSKQILEGIIGSKIKHFAYPNGKLDVDFDASHQKIIRDLGFESGLSTNWGALTDIASQRYNIPRFTPWDDSSLLFSLRLINNFRIKSYA
jgi:peptidoglycan/xylan/chitin deacetylase (PgdA/CDA1 family)